MNASNAINMDKDNAQHSFHQRSNIGLDLDASMPLPTKNVLGDISTLKMALQSLLFVFEREVLNFTVSYCSHRLRR